MPEETKHESQWSIGKPDHPDAGGSPAVAFDAWLSCLLCIPALGALETKGAAWLHDLVVRRISAIDTISPESCISTWPVLN